MTVSAIVNRMGANMEWLVFAGGFAAVGAVIGEFDNKYEDEARRYADVTRLPARKDRLENALAKHGDVRTSTIGAVALGIGATGIAFATGHAPALRNLAAAAGAAALVVGLSSSVIRVNDGWQLEQSTYTVGDSPFTLGEAADRIEHAQFSLEQYRRDYDLTPLRSKLESVRTGDASATRSDTFSAEELMSIVRKIDADKTGTIDRYEWRTLEIRRR